MPKLTELTRYADAQAQFLRDKLWELFDGNAQQLNIAHECLDRHVGRGRAVSVAHADGRDEHLSFAELAAWSARFANYLRAEGIAPGERVALMLEPSLLFYASLFGAMKAGAVAVPLFTLFGPDGLRLRLGDCGPKLLLLPPQRGDLAAAAGDARVVLADDDLLRRLAALPGTFRAATAADDMAMYQYTSGTTRELPEAVKHTHRAVVVVSVAALYGTGVRPDDRFFCPSSPAWGHGLWHGTIAPLALGASTGSMAGRFDPERLLRALQDYDITNLAAAATHYRMLRNCGAAGRYRYAVRKLSFTGEPIDSATADFARATFGVPLCSMYGTTEVGVILASYPGAEDFEVRPGALGKPVPGVEVAVLDAGGRPCPPGQVGEIKVKRRDGWFATKDLGHVDAEGYFYHNGRADDVIISAGWTMSAVEIEDVLLKHADVREAAAIGVPDALRGQVVKAFIVSPRTGDETFARELQDFVRTRLSQHEYPRQLAFVAELPKTPAGKVNRRALRVAEAARQTA
ncbi:MAG: AMP-binding protein [Alphaproteobacteria bacterium]|nr:AMP-binding protein [Alphaproteobacteria bacterium]